MLCLGCSRAVTQDLPMYPAYSVLAGAALSLPYSSLSSTKIPADAPNDMFSSRALCSNQYQSLIL